MTWQRTSSFSCPALVGPRNFTHLLTGSGLSIRCTWRTCATEFLRVQLFCLLGCKLQLRKAAFMLIKLISRHYIPINFRLPIWMLDACPENSYTKTSGNNLRPPTSRNNFNIVIVIVFQFRRYTRKTENKLLCNRHFSLSYSPRPKCSAIMLNARIQISVQTWVILFGI